MRGLSLIADAVAVCGRNWPPAAPVDLQEVRCRLNRRQIVDDRAATSVDYVARAADVHVPSITAVLEPAVIWRRMAELDVRKELRCRRREVAHVEDVHVSVG